MTKPLHIAVLGCSRIAQRSLIPAIQSLPERYQLAGIASRSAEKAATAAREFCTQAFSPYEALLDSRPLDAVYIPLPNALHAEWIEKAFDRGLHVLVEKSLACTEDDVERLCQMAKAKGLVLVENFQFRFHRQLAVIQDLVAGGKIGELRCVRSSFGFPPFADAENIRYNSALGGGALLDSGAYPIKISQLFLGADIEVAAAQWHIAPETKVDTHGAGVIRQLHGPLTAQFAFGFDHFYQCNIDLWGSKGKLYANRVFTAPPGFVPEIILETTEGVRRMQVDHDNHFINMLRYFHRLTQDPGRTQEEYRQNILQARLIHQFRGLANANANR